MEEQQRFELDLDSEKVLFEGAWADRQELADRIKQMIENQDFRISAVGNALEFLESAVRDAREFSVKLTGPDADALEQYAQENNLSAASALRYAWQAFYSPAQPPTAEENVAETPAGSAEEAPPTPQVVAPPQITITTEPVQPGEASGVVELTERKTQQDIPKVVVDPSLTDPPPETGGDQASGKDAVLGDWFKR